MPIKMTAHDGKTDIYGLMFRADELRSVEEVSDRQQRLSRVRRPAAPAAARSRAARGDRQALAELGFVVVTIDGMGTPGRSKAFQDAYYGAMGRDNTIPDQIAGMKELAQKISVHRSVARRHLGPLGRRLRDDDRDVPVSRLLQGRDRRVGQPRSARERGRLGRAVPGARRARTPTAPTATTPKRTRTSRRT